MTGTRQRLALGQDWGYRGTATTRSKCHLLAVTHLLPLLHKRETGLVVHRPSLTVNKARAFSSPLQKSFQLQPCCCWLVTLSPQACFWSKTLHFASEKLEVIQPLASSFGVHWAFPQTLLLCLPTSLSPLQDRGQWRDTAARRADGSAVQTVLGKICLGHSLCNQGSVPERCENQHVYLAAFLTALLRA